MLSGGEEYPVVSVLGKSFAVLLRHPGEKDIRGV